MLIILWGIELFGAFTGNMGSWTIGLLIAPMITIPLSILLTLFNNFWIGLVSFIWVAVSIFLIMKGSEKD